MPHFRPPAERHKLRRVTQRTVAKQWNTVIEPNIDVAGDVAAINQGLAQEEAGTFVIHGRTYGVHEGTLYPIAGPGFILLERTAFHALGVYNTHGNTERAAAILDAMARTDPALTPDQRLAALQAWQASQKGVGS